MRSSNGRFVSSAWGLVLGAGLLLSSGCASSSLMRPVAGGLPTLPPDQARVTFMRVSNVGGAIKSSVMDVTSGEPRLIGILSPDTKVIHETTPGRHVYMVVGESADFMEADLVAGKNYYTLVTPRMGAWKARFSFHPLKQQSADPDFALSSPNFKKWLDRAKPLASTPEAEAWMRANEKSIKEKQREYGEKWQRKSDADKKKYSLAPEDGL